MLESFNRDARFWGGLGKVTHQLLTSEAGFLAALSGSYDSVTSTTESKSERVKGRHECGGGQGIGGGERERWYENGWYTKYYSVFTGYKTSPHEYHFHVYITRGGVRTSYYDGAERRLSSSQLSREEITSFLDSVFLEFIRNYTAKQTLPELRRIAQGEIAKCMQRKGTRVNGLW